jgi:hypothetical protein
MTTDTPPCAQTPSKIPEIQSEKRVYPCACDPKITTSDDLKVIYDGIELFTINLTGESSMSESGLAILCGVHQTTIHHLLARNSVNTKQCVEWLKPFLDNSFHLILRG